MNKNINEPLLQQDDSRYVMFPIKDQDIWKMYKKQEDLFWRAEEIDLSKDNKDWETLNDDEKHFISMIFKYFILLALNFRKAKSFRFFII